MTATSIFPGRFTQFRTFRSKKDYSAATPLQTCQTLLLGFTLAFSETTHIVFKLHKWKEMLMNDNAGVFISSWYSRIFLWLYWKIRQGASYKSLNPYWVTDRGTEITLSDNSSHAIFFPVVHAYLKNLLFALCYLVLSRAEGISMVIMDGQYVQGRPVRDSGWVYLRCRWWCRGLQHAF